MIQKIHSTMIAVADQDAAFDFYTAKLGWRTTMDTRMDAEMRWILVDPQAGGTQLSVAHESWADGSTPGGYSGIVLTALDIDAKYATLVERGVKIKHPVEVMPWGQKAAWFYDIDDNEFFLVEE